MSILARLIAAGVDADLIEDVALLIAEKKAAEKLLEDRKRKAAERQQRKRARDAESRNVTPCHVTERDKRDPSLSLPPLSSPHTPLLTPPTHTHPDNNTRARKGGSQLAAKPEEVTCATWRDFQALRQRKRAPLTETAMAGIVREAAKAGWSLESALAECSIRGWQAFKAEWVNGKPDPSAGTGGHDASRAAFERRHGGRVMTESEARALMDPAEFEQWKARQSAQA